MKIGKLIYDDESGQARIKFNTKFINNFYGYEQLDLIQAVSYTHLTEWYETIMEGEVMQGDEIADRACDDDLEEDAEYGPPIN